MTRYEILANYLSNMLHKQLSDFENKLLLMEPADILDNSYEYVAKSNLISIIDDLLDSEWLDEDEIVVLINKSLEDLYVFFEDKFDIKASEVYSDCVDAFCLEALEAKEN